MSRRVQQQLLPLPLPRRLALDVGVFFLISLTVLAILFVTVHRRDLEAVQQYKSRTHLDRFDLTVHTWLQGGFLRHGGMYLMTLELSRAYYPEQVPPDSKLPPNSVFAYKNGTASYIVPLYWIQSIPWVLSGRTSPTLTLIYNQFMIALVAVALAMLALRVSRHFEMPRIQCFVLATCCLVSYQTFAPSLASYWEVSHVSVTLLFALILLSYDFDGWDEPQARSRLIVRGALATLILLGEPATGGLFLLFYLALRAVMSERGVATSDAVALFIVPALIVAAYVQVQHLLVRANHSSVYFIGSSLISRTGLDGDTTWYRDHWDLLLRGHFRRLNFSVAPLVEWPALLFAGLLTTVFLTTRYVTDLRLREPVRTLLAAVGLYLPMVFVFSQGVYIHPMLYDVVLVIPCILAVFCLLPAYLEGRFGGAGLFTFTALAIAAAYALVQLRTYVVGFPLPS